MSHRLPRAVLHITSASGGGVDRYVRDLASTVPGIHTTCHVGSRLDVIEEVAAHRFWPIAACDPRAAAALGRSTTLVHLHGVDRGCRARLQRLRELRHIPFVVTLHDVGFLHPDAFGEASLPGVDPSWLAEVRPLLQQAGKVLAPSRYIAELVGQWFSDLDVAVVPPGLRSEEVHAKELPEEFTSSAPRNVVAVVGAIGRHKGSALLAEIGAGLASHDATLVVLGYTDDRLTPGWISPGLFIHGPYEDAALPGWLAAYAPTLALFPNRLPESFSYTLSEVWAAGIPAMVPDEGALGERVAEHGGGWRLPAGFEAEDAVTRIVGLLGPTGAEEVRRVKSAIVPSDPAQIPPLSAMSSAIGAVYERFGLAPAAGVPPSLDSEAWQRLLAVNLDGFAFRQELVHLCESLRNVEARAQAAAENAEANRLWAERVESELQAARAWATKVETDVAALNEGIAHRDGLVQELREGVEWLRGELARVSTQSEQTAAERDRAAGELERAAAELARSSGELARLTGELEAASRDREAMERDRAALDQLPRWLSAQLRKRVDRVRG